MRKQTCYKCGTTKAVSLFEKTRKNKSGRTNRCKSCKSDSNNKATKAFHRMREKQSKYPIAIETNRFEVAQIFEIFEGVCAYCHVTESEETGTFHLEHIRALANGGQHVAWNLVIACKKCNSKKQNRPLIEFYRMYPEFRWYSLEFIFKYVARFSNQSPEEVAKSFYAEVDDDEQT